MEQKSTWQEIEKLYDKEWVLLDECEWADEDVNPKAGIVRLHAKSREEFDKLLAGRSPSNSAIVYIGEPDIPPNEIINTFNIIKVSSFHA